MKGITSFKSMIRSLRKSGKLDDAVGQKLTKTVRHLQREIHAGNRREAEKHFIVLCSMMRDILSR